MGHYLPHTDDDIRSMLEFIGLSSVEELFAVVPDAIRLAGGLDMPAGLSEFDTLAEMERLAARNRLTGPDLVCFAGGGAYDHDIPAAVRHLAFRSEFVTAYTPYQPEVAQGVLQALFEYQTLVARLSGLEVANASLYDGATACVEALNLAVAASSDMLDTETGNVTTDAKGEAIHRNGISAVPGLYFLGLQWLSKMNSSFLSGVGDDAAVLADHILGRR